MQAANDLRQRLFRIRGYTPIPFLVALAVVAQPTATSLAVGFFFVAVGESARLWGVAIAGGEMRTTTSVGGTCLVTHGPFAHVRNPLYLANMLMYFGVGVMSNVFWLALTALVYFLWQYSLIVSVEEEYLTRTFKEDYVRYCRAVSRFVPRLHPYVGTAISQRGASLARGLASERRTLQAIALLIATMLTLWFTRGGTV